VWDFRDPAHVPSSKTGTCEKAPGKVTKSERWGDAALARNPIRLLLLPTRKWGRDLQPKVAAMSSKELSTKRKEIPPGGRKVAGSGKSSNRRIRGLEREEKKKKGTCPRGGKRHPRIVVPRPMGDWTLAPATDGTYGIRRKGKRFHEREKGGGVGKGEVEV